MPLYHPKYDESLAKVCQELKDKWIQWDPATSSPFKPEDISSFSAGQKIEFMSLLLTEEPLRYIKKKIQLQTSKEDYSALHFKKKLNSSCKIF